MKSFEIDGRVLKAASFFQAKNDVRWYLEGIHIDESGQVTATNGQTLFTCNGKQDDEIEGVLNPPDQSVIVSISGTIPSNAHRAIFEFVDDKKGIITFVFLTKGSVKYLPFELIDGKFPDYKRAIPESDPEPTSLIGINADYVALVGKAAKALNSDAGTSKVELRGETNAVVFKPYVPFDHKPLIVIMPCRI